MRVCIDQSRNHQTVGAIDDIRALLRQFRRLLIDPHDQAVMDVDRMSVDHVLTALGQDGQRIPDYYQHKQFSSCSYFKSCPISLS